MIRPTEVPDRPILVELARETGVFKPVEVAALDEVLGDYYEFNADDGHKSITFEAPDGIQGFAYYAPAAMTDGTWYLWWIAVAKKTHAKGIGGALLKYAEQDIQKLGGRILLIETSSLPYYELTRKFYLKHQYQQVAVLPDYYSDADDMVIFRKRFH